MIHGFKHNQTGRRRGWAVMCQPDGSTITQALPVYRTRRAALDLATRIYVSWLATNGLPWDVAVGIEYRAQYECFAAIRREQGCEPLAIVAAV